MPSKQNKLMKTTLAVTMIIILSKGVGFIREMIMAYYFGRDMITDAYNSAYSLFYLPVLLFSSCITSTLVPLYIQKDRSRGREKANRFASNTLNLFVAFSLIIAVIMMAFAPFLVGIVYPGFEGEAFSLTVQLTRIMLPALAFFVAGLVLSTILNAQEHYLAAQLTGLPLSFALISAAILFSGSYGIYAQAWGVVAAGVLQLIILYPALRHDYRYSFTFNLHDKAFKKLMVLAVPAVLSMAANELNHMIDRMLASTLNAGDISAMAYAFKLIMFMSGVLVVPLTTISFSKMSKKASKDDPSSVVPHARNSIEILASVLLPVSAIAAVCAVPAIRLVYGRGQFDEASVQITGTVFMYYVTGVPFFGIRDLLSRVYHSFQNTKAPMVITFVSMAINILLNLILRPIMGVNGLAFATTIAALSSVIMLAMGLKKQIPKLFSRRFCLNLCKIVLATGIGLIVSILLARLLPEPFGVFRILLHLAAVALAGIAAYLAACVALGVKSIKKLTRIFRR